FAASPAVPLLPGFSPAVNYVFPVTPPAGSAVPLLVSLSAPPRRSSDLPTPASATCTPTAPCTVTFALSASSTATTGTVTITVTGTGRSEESRVGKECSLTVVATTLEFTVSVGSPSVSITQGVTTPVNEVITVTTTAGTAAPVLVSLSALPSSVTAVRTPASSTSTPTAPCTVTFALSASSTATTGTVTITVTGTG